MKGGNIIAIGVAGLVLIAAIGAFRFAKPGGLSFVKGQFGTATAAAAPLDWVRTSDEMSAVSQLGAGYAWAHICDRKVDMSAAARFLEAKLGRAHQYSAAQVADMMFLVVGSIGFEQQMVGRSGCTDLQKLYGPKGTAIPGLLD